LFNQGAQVRYLVRISLDTCEIGSWPNHPFSFSTPRAAFAF